MRKSIYLNAKQPLYTTRYNIGCVAFKAQSKQREIDANVNIEHSKKMASLAQERLVWITNAYVSLRDRLTTKLLTTN